MEFPTTFQVYLPPKLPHAVSVFGEPPTDSALPNVEVLTIEYRGNMLDRVWGSVRAIQKNTGHNTRCVLVGWKAYLCLDFHIRRDPTCDHNSDFRIDHGRIFLYGIEVIVDPRAEEWSVVAIPTHETMCRPEWHTVAT